jgi:hypothetical protein
MLEQNVCSARCRRRHAVMIVKVLALLARLEGVVILS